MYAEAVSCLFLTLTVATSLVDDQPYCSLRYRRLCQGKGRHVACQFPVPGPNPYCVNYTKIKFTGDLRNFITHYINRRRQRIATGNERVRGGAHIPKPEIMMWVSWDRELAHLAQRLADQCRFVHDDCRATVRYPYAGQTVGEVRWRRSSDSEELSAQRAIRRVFDAWWGERRRVQPKQLIAPFRLTPKGSVWGHFSQLAVWTLRAVGCGAVTHGDAQTRMLLVCDFSHTNMLGERTINPGPLAACPAHTARKIRTSYPLLCAPMRQTTESRHEEYDGYASDEDDEAELEEVDKKKLPRKHLDIGYLTTRKTTRALDILDQELEKPRSMTQLKAWPTRPRLEVHGLDNGESDEKKFADKLQHLYRSQTKEDVFVDKGFMEPPQIRQDPVHKEQVIRQRWKQTRFRPRRPGAKALFNKPENQYERSSLPSLMIDKDDMDQLFRDTGFKISGRKR
ncbi:unnamed protein product [Pieris macdunnoughi]|uniref:SCP domain-containing protein n=1 Tax=Pieris macdunnoughi TaxID=345717 RepID=A0A821R738_9NEOP|nr:unnamed protein product [Pieris macdunnoughi]